MGFVKEDGFYVPNTVLREDLRNITIKPRQVVLMMFLKNRKDIQYFELTYIKKGLMINDVKFMDILARKVDLEKLKASFEIPYNKISAT